MHSTVSEGRWAVPAGGSLACRMIVCGKIASASRAEITCCVNIVNETSSSSWSTHPSRSTTTHVAANFPSSDKPMHRRRHLFE